MKRNHIHALTFGCLMLMSFSGPSFAWEEEHRTVHRSPTGLLTYQQQYFARPEHYEFLPLVSNHDPQHQHPQQWEGQDWDPSAWNPSQWTPEIAIQKFYSAHIFEKQYMSGKVPVLELGHNFYRLSDLDRRRTIKLLVDNAGLFEKGYEMVALVDWYTRKSVGSYTRHGMQLN